MAYDNSSLNGDIICEDYYDVSNNLMNPESPVGYFLYKVIGCAFDELDQLVNQFRIDLSILDCNVGSNQVVDSVPETFDDGVTYYVPVYTSNAKEVFRKYVSSDDYVLVGNVKNALDRFWGRSYGFVRPSISYVQDGVIYHRLLTDKEYKIYLYLRNHQLLTRKDIIVAFNNAFNTDDESIELTTANLDNASMVNHKQYDNPSFTNNTLSKYDDSDSNCITDKLNNSDVNLVSDKITQSNVIMIVVPGEWDKNFLSFLEQYSSIKGNVLISQGG